MVQQFKEEGHGPPSWYLSVPKNSRYLLINIIYYKTDLISPFSLGLCIFHGFLYEIVFSFQEVAVIIIWWMREAVPSPVPAPLVRPPYNNTIKIKLPKLPPVHYYYYHRRLITCMWYRFVRSIVINIYHSLSEHIHLLLLLLPMYHGLWTAVHSIIHLFFAHSYTYLPTYLPLPTPPLWTSLLSDKNHVNALLIPPIVDIVAGINFNLLCQSAVAYTEQSLSGHSHAPGERLSGVVLCLGWWWEKGGVRDEHQAAAIP